MAGARVSHVKARTSARASSPGSGGPAVNDEQLSFGCVQRTVAGTTVLELSGEVDILAVARMSTRFDAQTSAGRPGPPDVVVDLRAVRFIDCSGLSLLCRLRSRVLAGGGRLRLVSDDPRFLRLLRLTRLAYAFEVHEDLASALAARPVGETDEGVGGAIA